MVGVARPTVSEWETNKKDPSGERLKRLSEIFEVDPLVILGRGVPEINLQQIAPQTPEARIVSFGMDRLPESERQRILGMLQLMYNNNPDFFRKGNNDDDT